MTNISNYPLLRNGNLEGGGLPPHYVDEKKNQVVFHLPGGYPTTLAIPTWMERFPDNYKGVAVRCEETFYKWRAKVNED